MKDFLKRSIYWGLLFFSCFGSVYGQLMNDPDTPDDIPSSAILLPVKSGGKVGFINGKGKVVIQPAYQKAGDFSEGLALVKMNGKFGYINTKGKIVIPCMFDSANPFANGIAAVFNAHNWSYINKLGKTPFSLDANFLGNFQNGRAYIYSRTAKEGIIDTQGKFIVDTIYSQIDDFSCGRAVVHNFHYITDPNKGPSRQQADYGVIDEEGKIIVPFGIYSLIHRYSGGFSLVTIHPTQEQNKNVVTSLNPNAHVLELNNPTEQWGVIDVNGKLLYSAEIKNNCYPFSEVHDGYINMHLFKYWNCDSAHPSECNYFGIIDVHGKYLLKDTSYMGGLPFSDGRAFVMDVHRNFHIFDRQGKMLDHGSYCESISGGFRDGITVVNNAVLNRIEIIDTNANVLANILPGLTHIRYVDYKHKYLFINDGESKSSVADFAGNIIIKPQEINFAVYPGTSVIAGYKVYSNSRSNEVPIVYYDEKGNLIWEKIE